PPPSWPTTTPPTSRASGSRPTAASSSGSGAPADLARDADDRGARERVGAVVQRVAAVARDLVPGDVVVLEGQGDQRLPEIAVVQRLLLGVDPAVLPPALVPAVAKAVDHVRAVAVDGDAPPASERRPSSGAVSSMRWLVVGFSPPESSSSRPSSMRRAPQPPGPGLPEQAPSVYMTIGGDSLISDGPSPWPSPQ